jgi:hypothetical protein
MNDYNVAVLYQFIGECFGTLRFLERYTGAQRYELGSDTRSLRKSW